jgi:hypothetical protein
VKFDSTGSGGIAASDYVVGPQYLYNAIQHNGYGIFVRAGTTSFTCAAGATNPVAGRIVYVIKADTSAYPAKTYCHDTGVAAQANTWYHFRIGGTAAAAYTFSFGVDAAHLGNAQTISPGSTHDIWRHRGHYHERHQSVRCGPDSIRRAGGGAMTGGSPRTLCSAILKFFGGAI